MSVPVSPTPEPRRASERWATAVGDQSQAERREIIRVICGSEVHGMAISGHDDHDEMGVYLNDPEQLLGVTPAAGHFTARTQPMGARSHHGDTDLSMYSLGHYLRLALAGNPTVLTVLYAPTRAVLSASRLGGELRDLAPKIVSRSALWRHLGYLNGQRERMTGGGRQSRVPNRPELIEAHGYDTKYASHALRLGLQGVQLGTTGRLTLPMEGEDLAACMEIKRGEVDFPTALAWVDAVRERLTSLAEGSQTELRAEPDLKAVNEWMISAHQRGWNWR